MAKQGLITPKQEFPGAALAALIVSVYLLMVWWRNRLGDLQKLMSESRSFVLWAGAILVWYAIQDRLPAQAQSIAGSLALMATIGLLLRNVEAIPDEIERTLDLFKPSETKGMEPASPGIPLGKDLPDFSEKSWDDLLKDLGFQI